MAAPLIQQLRFHDASLGADHFVSTEVSISVSDDLEHAAWSCARVSAGTAETIYVFGSAEEIVLAFNRARNLRCPRCGTGLDIYRGVQTDARGVTNLVCLLSSCTWTTMNYAFLEDERLVESQGRKTG